MSYRTRSDRRTPVRGKQEVWGRTLSSSESEFAARGFIAHAEQIKNYVIIIAICTICQSGTWAHRGVFVDDDLRPIVIADRVCGALGTGHATTLQSRIRVACTTENHPHARVFRLSRIVNHNIVRIARYDRFRLRARVYPKCGRDDFYDFPKTEKININRALFAGCTSG